ncbi:hypothetical protein C8F01DRAFT_1248577 [Mycena amicta]|nr:hypothetical protein C8F01DRAFT_1248577 [Mycena amicta]
MSFRVPRKAILTLARLKYFQTSVTHDDVLSDVAGTQRCFYDRVEDVYRLFDPGDRTNLSGEQLSPTHASLPIPADTQKPTSSNPEEAALTLTTEAGWSSTLCAGCESPTPAPVILWSSASFGDICLSCASFNRRIGSSLLDRMAMVSGGPDDYHFLPSLHAKIRPKAIHDAEVVEEYSKEYIILPTTSLVTPTHIKSASLPPIDDVAFQLVIRMDTIMGPATSTKAGAIAVGFRCPAHYRRNQERKEGTLSW